MIQLGPLELNSATAETPVGVRAATETTMSTGEIIKTRKEQSTLRLKVRLHRDDPTYKQLIEMSQNYKIAILPLYSGYENLDGLYVLRTITDRPINWLWHELIINLEDVGSYFRKVDDKGIRTDDWGVMYQEDFEDWVGGEILLDYQVWGWDTGVNVEYDEDPPVGSKCGVLSNSQDVTCVLFGFEHWKNYSYSVWVKSSSTDPFGIMWRATTGNITGAEDDFSGYLDPRTGGAHFEFLIDTTNNKYRVEYHSSWESDNKELLYEEEHEGLEADTWYLLQIICVGEYHFCMANGRIVTYFKDERCAGGNMGVTVRESGAAVVYMDNILVQQVPSGLMVLDETYSNPDGKILKQRETLYGKIAYSEDPTIKYKATTGGSSCILHLRMDQGYGHVIFDKSSYNHDARIMDGQWKDGYMRFKAGGRGLKISHDADLDNDDEGTVIIRMRLNAPSASIADPIIRRGTTDWAIWMGTNNGDQLFSCAEEPGSTAAGTAPRTSIYPLRPDYEWRTYVIRWKDSINRWEMYVDGVATGSDYSNIQSGYGTATGVDMLIGQANVDIEYILVYDQWIEEPSISGGTSSKILDVDSHHDNEVLDIRFNEQLDYVKEYWSNLTPALTGTPEYQDYDHDYDSKPLLYRRSGSYMTDAELIKLTLPDHLSNKLHAMDWTLELVMCRHEGDAASAKDLLVIGNSTKSTKTVRLYSEYDSTLDGWHWSTVDQSAGAKTGNFYEGEDTWGKNTGIAHITYRTSNRELRYYWFGEYRGKETLADDLGLLTDTVHVGGTEGTYYRVRIIASALNTKDLKKITDEYKSKPTQVFSQHEFKGYPELTNGLITTRGVVTSGDDVHGDKQIVELFDDGQFILPEGNVGTVTDLMAAANIVMDDEGVATTKGDEHTVWLMDAQPVIYYVDQDEVTIESRNQFRVRNPIGLGSGTQLRTQISISTGLYGLDVYSYISSRTRGWEMMFGFTDMQCCWREGGHSPHLQDNKDEVRGDFHAASGQGTSYDMDQYSSFEHLRNYSIFMNLNPDRSTWDARNYMIGVMPEHTDDYLYVDFETGGYTDVIQGFWFDDLHSNASGGFRTAIAIIPMDNTKVFNDPNASSPWSWTLNSYFTNSVDADSFNNQKIINDGSSNVPEMHASMNFEKGTWKSWWGVYGTLSIPFVQFRIHDGGDYVIKKQYLINTSGDQVYKDMSFTIPEDGTYTIGMGTRASDNVTDSFEIDGIIFFPCHNGADWILDQLYALRSVKNIRRYPM